MSAYLEQMLSNARGDLQSALNYIAKLVAEIDRLKSERLRWTKGGNGSHWDGCEEVHWDCKIVKLQAEIDRLKEDLANAKDELKHRRDAKLKPKTVYTVTMYRYGNREWHSYVLGAFSSNDIAHEWAVKEEEYRDGKYKAEIIRWGIDSPTDFLKEEL